MRDKKELERENVAVHFKKDSVLRVAVGRSKFDFTKYKRLH